MYVLSRLLLESGLTRQKRHLLSPKKPAEDIDCIPSPTPRNPNTGHWLALPTLEEIKTDDDRKMLFIFIEEDMSHKQARVQANVLWQLKERKPGQALKDVVSDQLMSLITTAHLLLEESKKRNTDKVCVE